MAKKKFKEFILSSWGIDNRTTIYLLTGIIVILGLFSYQSLPKENFPEINLPQILVATPYPGTSPADMENLVTREIEQEMKSIKGVKNIKSNSFQDFSLVIVEFETNMEIKEAKKEVKDAVDRARPNLPQDLPREPTVQDINLSELPIMFVNVSGKMPLDKIKQHAEDIADEIEKLPEINRVDIVGGRDREIQINVDLYKMQASSYSFGDIESAITRENMVIASGEIEENKEKVAVRLDGEFQSVKEIEELIIRGPKGNTIPLKEIASVQDTFADIDSYARMNGNPVVTLNVVKKAGENLIDASDKIKLIVQDFDENRLPEPLSLKIFNDQSKMTTNMLNELLNTIIIGFILVTLVLMFFMGLQDAMFVGMAVPLSSLIAFIVLPAIGFTMNLVVLFTFIFALGIVVDNAIVVIENTHRIFNKEKLPIKEAAKKAAGEVIGPVFAGTLTTMAPFLPLAFWEGTVGEFMFFLPITIIITLLASLLVAYVINPVLAVSFMKSEEERQKKGKWLRYLIVVGIMFVIMGLMYITSGSNIYGEPLKFLFLPRRTWGNILLIFGILALMWRFVLKPAINWFQKKAIPWMIKTYAKLLTWALAKSIRSYIMLGGTVVLLIFSIMLFGARQPKVINFPVAQPNFVYVYTEFPIGTAIEYTDSVTLEVEDRVYAVLGKENPLVKSIITNVGRGATTDMDFNKSSSLPHKSKVTIEFVEYKYRDGVSTIDLMSDVRSIMRGGTYKGKEFKPIEGAEISVEQEASGPPAGYPVNIEVSSERFDILVSAANGLKSHLEKQNIAGIEELKMDVALAKKESILKLDRQKAQSMGISSGQVGSNLRTAILGKEISKFRQLEDQYEIRLRLDEKYRQNLDQVLNMRVVFMDMATGGIKEVPISTVVERSDTSTYGQINRIDLKKAITVYSNLLEGANLNEVAGEVQYQIDQYISSGGLEEYVYNDIKVKDAMKEIEIKMTGEVQQQEESSGFLAAAMGIAVLLIFLILVAQFNSLSKVVIILSQIFLSMIGVFLGFALTGMEVSIVMTGVGVVSLAGIVVNNGILLLDFIDLRKKEGMGTRAAIINGGSTRLTPVILTASSTVLGLLPMAFGMNINFNTLFSNLNPQIYFGGDTSVMWGPLSWTIIFGLSFATIVTLVVVPILYYTGYTRRIWVWRKINRIRKSKMFS